MTGNGSKEFYLKSQA